jgi:hypothetical protein
MHAEEKDEAKLELKEATQEVQAVTAAALEQSNVMKETLDREQQQTKKAYQRAKHAEREISRLEKVIEEEKGHVMRQRTGMIKLVSSGRMLSNDVVAAYVSDSGCVSSSCQTTPELSSSDGMLSD